MTFSPNISEEPADAEHGNLYPVDSDYSAIVVWIIEVVLWPVGPGVIVKHLNLNKLDRSVVPLKGNRRGGTPCCVFATNSAGKFYKSHVEMLSAVMLPLGWMTRSISSVVRCGRLNCIRMMVLAAPPLMLNRAFDREMNWASLATACRSSSGVRKEACLDGDIEGAGEIGILARK